MYNKFITAYGSDAKLTALQKGDPKAKTAPDPKEYASRLGFLAEAYADLSTTYYSFFNYQRAAETQEKVSTNTRFDDKKRKEAAGLAMDLYNALGQRDKMTAQYKILTSLHPDPDEQAAADYRSRTTTSSSGIRPPATAGRTTGPASRRNLRSWASSARSTRTARRRSTRSRRRIRSPR